MPALTNSSFERRPSLSVSKRTKRAGASALSAMCGMNSSLLRKPSVSLPRDPKSFERSRVDLDFVAVFGPALIAPATNLARAGLAGRVFAQARTLAGSSLLIGDRIVRGIGSGRG